MLLIDLWLLLLLVLVLLLNGLNLLLAGAGEEKGSGARAWSVHDFVRSSERLGAIDALMWLLWRWVVHDDLASPWGVE